MWVEVRIEDDNGVCGVKVDTNTTGPGGQKVDEDFRAGFVEFVDTLLSERAPCVTILEGTVSNYEQQPTYPHTKRRCLIPSPSKKSSTMSRTILNCARSVSCLFVVTFKKRTWLNKRTR